MHLTIAELRAWAGGRRDLAFLLLDMLLDVVYAEGPLAPNKFMLVRKLCCVARRARARTRRARRDAWLCLCRVRAPAAGAGAAGLVSRSDERRSDAPRQPAGKDPYAVLGITRDAHEREIKRAYRKLISQHHPDKLGDVPDELKRRAEERAREINAAYETDTRGTRNQIRS